jgi:quercetin dioxygenase-like cupin family protein
MAEKTALHFLDNLLFIHLRSDEVDGQVGMVEFIGPPGDGAAPHVHNLHHECFYVVEGELTMFFPDREVVLEQGEFIRAPQGVPHTFRVTSDTNARWFIWSVPGGFEGFAEEYGELTDDLTLPEHTPPDIERMKTLSAKYGIEVLGPPGMLPKDLPPRS